MKPLRVLSLATLYPNASAPNFGVFVERQMEAVAARGDVDLTIVNPIGIAPFPLSLHPRYRALSRQTGRDEIDPIRLFRPRFRVWPGLNSAGNPKSIIKAVAPLARALHAEEPFDLVDAQFFFPDGPAAVGLARHLGLPCSIKARGADIHHWGRHPDTSDLVLDAGLQADGLLAVSDGMAQAMADLGMPRDSITVHRTGLDHRIFRPHDKSACRALLGLPSSGPVLACVGALIPRKGQDIAIAALATVPDATLVLAGAGPDEQKLRKLAHDLGLEARVRFLGAVPHEQLPVMLSAADLFVLPTQSEGLANAWLEALACGLPVVTSAIPGADELITSPALGRLVQREPNAFAAAINELLAAPAARKKVLAGAAAYSWEANADALVRHWRSLVRP